MKNFYKISSEKATSIGVIEYEFNKFFNPFVGEQNDGTFLVSEEMYNTLKDIIDFGEMEKISQDQLDNKIYDLNR